MKNRKFKFILAAIAAFFIFYLLISRHRNIDLVQLESPNKIAMNTVAKVIAVAPDEKTASLSIDSAFETIYRLEKLMNRYDPNSQLSMVNLAAARVPVKVDKDLFDILRQSIQYSRKTGGAFDITVGPLVDLWRKCAEANLMPTDQQLKEVKEKIGYEKLLLDSNDFSVRFKVEGMKLDLGAIAKGYAADRAIEEMKKCGAIGGMVGIGGQIGCFGRTEKRDKWTIGIQNPVKSDSKEFIAKLAISDMAVSTSGDYERFYKIGGRRFSHILNPETEKNASELSSVTIITVSGAEADAMATAVSVLGAEKGLELIEKTEDTEALLVKSGSGEIIKSSRAGRYLAK